MSLAIHLIRETMHAGGETAQCRLIGDAGVFHVFEAVVADFD